VGAFAGVEGGGPEPSPFFGVAGGLKVPLPLLGLEDPLGPLVERLNLPLVPKFEGPAAGSLIPLKATFF